MKRFVFIAFFVIHSLFCIAKPISKAESLKIAQQFYQKQCVPQGTNLKSATNLDFKLDFICTDLDLKLKSGSIVTSPKDSTGYYFIYNVGENQGFMIVSGDDRTTPVLGYSDDGKFDFANMPENIQEFMEHYKLQIKAITTQNNTLSLKSSMIVAPNDSAVAPLITTKWGQLAPYNSKIPISAPTGCLSTAMAQIMNYHKWPLHGTSSHSYTYNGNTFSVNFASTIYDWANMKNEYTAIEDIASASCKAVGTLMYNCGVSLDMQYNAKGSNAITSSVPTAFINYFGYDKNLQMIWSSDYTSIQWKYKVKSEINAKRPVMIFGTDGNSVGHEYIADGYDRYNFIHINWGWDGNYNGYYETDPLDASIYYVPGSLMIGIQKPTLSTNPSLCYNGFGLANNSTKKRNTSTSTTINVFEENGKSFNGEIGLAFFKNEILYKIISTTLAAINTSTTLAKSFIISIPDTLSGGTYRLVPIFKTASDANWSEIKYKNTILTTDTRINENVEFVVNGTDDTIFLNSKTMSCKKGYFKTYFSYEDWANIQRLVVRGEIDQWDMLYMAAGKSIKSIDIKDATIIDTKINTPEIAYGGKPTNFDQFVASLSSKWKDFENYFWHGIKYKDGDPLWSGITYGSPQWEMVKDDYSLQGSEYALHYDPKSKSYYAIYDKKPDYTDSQIIVQISGHQGLIWTIGGKGIMADAFSNSTLESITLPNNLKYIAPMAFANCPNLKTIVLPDSVALIGDSLFYNCPNLKEIQFPNTLNAIWSQGFSGLKNVEKITLPNSLDSIANKSFKGCTKLTSINMPENINKIGKGAFGGCSSLTTMTIPLSVDTIQSEAFLNCSGLTAIYAHSTTPVNLDSSPNVFFNSNKSASTCKLFVPAGSVSAYKAASQWKDFYNILEMPNFSISPTAANIGEGSGSYTDLVFISVTTAWNAYSNQSWLKIISAHGDGNGKLTFSANANPTTLARKATITVSATGFASQSISITQAAGAAKLSVSSNEISTTHIANGTQTIEVISNTEWTASSDQTWLTVNPVSGKSGYHKITFSVTPTIADRSAKVTISAPGVISQIITVTQLENEAAIYMSTSTSGLFTIGINAIATNTSIQIDWGDGKLVPYILGTDYMELKDSIGFSENSNISIYGQGIARLYVRGQNLTYLNVSNCPTLQILSCYNNKLTNLDLSENYSLTYLMCYKNKLIGINVSKNLNLIWLDCYDNFLNVLDVSKNAKLTYLQCHINQITALDLSQNSELNHLSCANNRLTTLNVTNNTKLQTLYCNNNLLTLANLPQPLTKYVGYTYAPQGAFSISSTIDKDAIVDLSSQLTAKDGNGVIKNTLFTCKTKGGNILIKGTDYAISEAGKFIFIKNQVDSIYCEMSNAAFPNFKEKDIFKTTFADIKMNPIPGNTGSISGTATVCQGQSALVYTVPSIANATSYAWTLPAGATGTSTINSITVNFGASAVSGNITVKGKNAGGDGALSILAITVNSIPESAGIISGTTTVCQLQNAEIYTVPVIANAKAYVWTLPEGATGTSTTNSISVNFGNTSVSGVIKVKGHNDCGDGTESFLSITINSVPSIPTIINSRPMTFYEGDSTVLVSSVPTGNQWYKEGVIMIGKITQNVTIKSSGIYTVTSSNGICLSNQSQSVTVTVKPDITPPISSIFALPAIVYGDSVLVKWSGTDSESGIKDYSIFVSDNGTSFDTWINRATITEAYFKGTRGKTYYFYCIGHDKKGNAELKSSSEAITWFALPVTISKKWDDVVVCNNSGKLFTSYQWYKNDAPISGATKQFYQESGGLNGSYYIIATTSDGRKGISNVTKLIATAKSVGVYPNPTGSTQEFNVVINASESDMEYAKFTISSVMGQVVIKKNAVQQQMKLGGLPKGMYIIQVVFSNGESLNKKLLVD